LAKKPSDARLLVSSVAPGSIDISLYPDLVAYLAALPMLAPLFDKAELIGKFGKTLKSLFELFKKKKTDSELGGDVSIKDCDDAINIVKPIANHGGTQTFNVINGGITFNILTMNASQASKIMEVALQRKALVQNSDAETRQRVPMVWKRLDRDATSPEAKSSPDRALIEEIDTKSRPVFFTDEMSFLKKQMIGDEENPYQSVYFVDVSISRVSGIYAFKVDAVGARTDLVFNEPPPDVMLAQAVEGMVLTEWKVAKDAKDAILAVRAARIQADQYSQGALAGLELRSHRYIIVMTLKELPPGTLGPDDRTPAGIIYRHINIVIEPGVPSKVSTLARAAK
jgi:hypothetical protein